jgi:hypothetical protein
MASASLRERRGKIAQRLAFERHDAGAVSESLRMMLNRAASGGDGV